MVSKMEVKVKVKVKQGEELSILGMTLEQVIDGNLKDAKVCRYAETLRESMVLVETDAGIAVSLRFSVGEIEIQNGTINSPTGYMEGRFETLAAISSGNLSPIRALLTRKIKAKGNLLKLLRVAKIMIAKE